MKSEDNVEIKVMDNGYVVYVNEWVGDDDKRKAMIFYDVDLMLAYVAKILKGE